MKTSSAKAKGRSLQKWVAGKVSYITGLPFGEDEVISSRGMGQSGTDVVLVGEAIKAFPFSIECKNQEKWSVHMWIDQALSNQKPGTDWLLVAKRRRKKPVVIIDADAFFDIYKKVIMNSSKKGVQG